MKYISNYIFVALFMRVTCNKQFEHHISDDDLYPRKDGFMILDQHNFVAALHKYRFVLAFYYGKDRESKEAEIEMNKVAQHLKDIKSDIQVAKINVDREHEILRKFPIRQEPTFRLFKNGKRYDYAGKQTSEKLITWIDLAMAVPLQINTAHELESLIGHTCVILGCFPGKAPAKAFENFYKVSEYFVYETHMPIPRFAVVTSAKLARELGVVSGSVTVYKRFEDGDKATYEGDAANFDKLLKFVEEETEPIVFKLHIHDYMDQMHHKTQDYQHILFMNSKDRNFPQVFKDFKKCAREYYNATSTNEVTFIHVDLKYSEHAKEDYITYYHIDVKKELPCNRMTKFDKYHSKFIPPNRDLSYNGFKSFTQSVLGGKIQRHIRSEEIPSDWNAYDVKVVVGKSYHNFVNDKARAVVMLLYLPNDSKSEAAIPVFNELAKEFRSNHSMVFGRLNLAVNDAEVGDVIKTPSVKLFNPDGKVIKYYMGFELKQLKQFILSGGANQPPMIDYEDDQFTFPHTHHTEESVEEEEKRKREWEEEERKMLSTAVTAEIGPEPHNDPNLLRKHPFHHLPLEERDPDHMDPKKHADFENLHRHQHDHTVEL